jgi:hypothetical protein
METQAGPISDVGKRHSSNYTSTKGRSDSDRILGNVSSSNCAVFLPPIDQQQSHLFDEASREDQG